MKYIIVVDKQSRTNPSAEKRETVIDIEELRRKGDVHDDFEIEQCIAKVHRRIGITEYNVTYILDKEIIEKLGEIKIKLFEGNNYIYIKDEYNNQMCAEYIIKNDFTDAYVTNLQMQSAIEESADRINIFVNQKLSGYSTTQEMNAAINIKADSITSTVSSTYATKGELSTAKSEIKQTTDSITSTVSKKVGNDEIISKINQSAEKILISGDKIDIDGKAVHFKTNVSETIGPFTEADAQKVFNYIVGKGTLTSAEFNKYDIDNDNRISVIDGLYIARAAANGGYYSFAGTYEINPHSGNKSIAIYNNNGYYSTIISLIHNYFQSLEVEVLETAYNDEKVHSYFSSSSISMSQEDTSNSVCIQVGNWYNNKSTSGISVTNGMPSKTKSIDIITQEDDAFITINNERVQAVSSLYTNSSGTTGTVTLSESVANFSHIEIFYGKNTGSMQSVKVYSANGKSATLDLAYKDSSFIQLQADVVNVSGTTISKTTYGLCNFYSGNFELVGLNEVRIFKVNGYR